MPAQGFAEDDDQPHRLPDSSGFFCTLCGNDSPLWILLPGPGAEPLTDFHRIVTALRKYLAANPENAVPDAFSERRLNEYLHRLAELENALLPRRKQRALKKWNAPSPTVCATLQPNGRPRRCSATANSMPRLTGGRQACGSRTRMKSPPAGDIIRPLWHERLADKRR